MMQGIKRSINLTGDINSKYIVNIIYDIKVTSMHDMTHRFTFMLEQSTSVPYQCNRHHDANPIFIYFIYLFGVYIAFNTVQVIS